MPRAAAHQLLHRFDVIDLDGDVRKHSLVEEEAECEVRDLAGAVVEDEAMIRELACADPG